MGSILSSFLCGDAASVSESSDNSVTTFHSYARWKLYLDEIKPSDSPHLVVIDFTAAWCRPCRRIEPTVQDIANEFKDVGFIKIDVDELPEVAEKYKVQAMPTFLFLKNWIEVHRIVGAKKEELESKIKEYRAQE